MVGVELRDGRCRYQVEVTAEDSLSEVVVAVRAPGVTGRNFGPFEKGERRVLNVTSGRRAPCKAGAKARVTNTSPGQPPTSWSAGYGLLRFATHGLAQPQGGAGCVVVTALRIATPGPLSPSVTLRDAKGRALETSDDGNACQGLSGKGIRAVYCATLARTPCAKIHRVTVTRGGASRAGTLRQARLRIDRCEDVGVGRARIAAGGGPLPGWAGRPGTLAFLLGTRGVPKTYAHAVALDASGALDVLSPRAKPCTEAMVLVLQRRD